MPDVPNSCATKLNREPDTMMPPKVHGSFCNKARRALTSARDFRLLTACALLSIAGQAIGEYHFDVWTADTGLPQNSVQSIVQTRDGYIWLATLDGLVRFDGVHFTVFDKSNSPGLPGNRVGSLYEDSSGALWVGTDDGGVARYLDGRFTPFTTAHGLASQLSQSISGDADGNVWVLSGNILARWNRSRFDPALPESLRPVFKPELIGSNRRGSIWVTNPDGVQLFARGRLTTLTLKDGLPSLSINHIDEDQRGTLWLATEDAGLVKVRDGKVAKVYSQRDGLPSNRIAVTDSGASVACEDRKGNVWVHGADAWLARLKDGVFTTYPPPNALAPGTKGIRVCAFHEDREGNLWIGTISDGLIRIREEAVSPLSARNGLHAVNIYPVYEDRTGAVWLGTWDKGLARVQDGVISNYALKGDNQGFVTALCEDRQGRLWVGTYGDIGIFRDGVLTPNGVPPELRRHVVSAIHQDRTGAMWFGVERGLFRYQNGELSLFTKGDGLAGEYLTAILEDRNGALWIGGHDGLSRMAGGRFTTWTERDGLPSNHVRALHEDDEGTLWIGTYDGGLGRFKDGKFTCYTLKEGMFNNGVFQILEDARGNFWMSCNRGIHRVNKRELNEFADGRRRTINSISYGKSDGMLNVECNGGRWPAGAKTRDGRLWFPTQDGVAVIDPEVVPLNPTPPPVVIESFRIDREPLGLKEPLRVPPGKANLEIQYTGLSLVNSERLSFKYRLENADADWVEAGTRRTAYYSHLVPGDYVFTVLAANSDGVWNESGASLAFVVQPFLWQTAWFRVGFFLLAITGTGTAVWRVLASKLRRQQERLEHHEALQRSQERLTLAVNAARVGVWTWQLQTNEVTWSENAEPLFGLKSGSFGGTFDAFLELVVPEDRDTVQRNINDTLTGRRAHYLCEFRIRWPDDSVHWLEGRGMVQRNPEGEPVRMTGTIVDISERKVHEEAWVQSEARLRRANEVLLELTHSEEVYSGELPAALSRITEAATRGLDVACASVWFLDLGHSKLCAFDCYDRRTDQHTKDLELIPAECPNYFKALMQDRCISAHDALANPRTSELREAYLIPRSIASMLDAGVWLHGELVGILRHEHVGPPRRWSPEEESCASSLAHFVQMALEARDRRLAEEARHATEALKGAILESALDCIITINHEGRILEFNAAAEKTFGYKEPQVLGKLLSETIVPPAMRQAHEVGLERHVRTGVTSILGRRIELTAVRADGSEFPVELSIVRIPGTRAPVFTAFLRDITERKLAEQTRERLRQLAQSLTACESVQEVATTLARACRDLLQYDAFLFETLDIASGLWTPMHAEDTPHQGAEPVPVVVTADPTRSRVLQSVFVGEPKLINRPDESVNLSELRPWGFVSRQSESLMFAGIRHEGVCIGVVSVQSYTSGRYRPKDLELLQLLADQCGPAVAHTRAEAALREEKNYVGTILDTASALIMVLDSDDRIVRFNKACEACTGYRAAEAQSRVVWKLLTPPEEIDRVRATLSRVKAGDSITGFESDCVTKSGARRLLTWNDSLVTDESGTVRLIICAGMDITEQRRIEEENRQAQDREKRDREEFTKQLLLTQEQERKRLANELHDSLGQSLSLIKNRAHLALENAPLPPRAADHLEAISKVVVQAIGETRNLAQNLRPLHIDQFGLTTSVEGLIDQTAQSISISIDRRLENVDDLFRGDDVTHVYRIIQEALNNLVKHSRATRATVKIERDLRCVRLCIEDDGCGFDLAGGVQTPRGAHGLGLTSMRERVRLLGGTLNLRSRSGRGTSVLVELPVSESGDGDPATS